MLDVWADILSHILYQVQIKGRLLSFKKRSSITSSMNFTILLTKILTVLLLLSVKYFSSILVKSAN